MSPTLTLTRRFGSRLAVGYLVVLVATAVVLVLLWAAGGQDRASSVLNAAMVLPFVGASLVLPLTTLPPLRTATHVGVPRRSITWFVLASCAVLTLVSAGFGALVHVLVRRAYVLELERAGVREVGNGPLLSFIFGVAVTGCATLIVTLAWAVGARYRWRMAAVLAVALVGFSLFRWVIPSNDAAAMLVALVPLAIAVVLVIRRLPT